jgi:exopolysaccharide production protein ExoQ
MPSLLALLICTIFVVFMLWIDRKQSPEVSFVLWIPTIWSLIISSKPLGIWFQSSGATMEEGSPLDRTFLTILLCLGLIIIAKRRFNWLNAMKENIWLMLLIGYMLISCLWSDVSFLSFKRWTRELIAVVMAFVVATEADPQRAWESLFRRVVYISIPFSYILINYFSEYGRLYLHHSGDLMWTGVTIHKNALAQMCLLAVFFLVWSIIRRQRGRTLPAVRYQTILEVFIIILAFWLWGGPQHSLTYSASATITFLLGLLALIGLFWSKKFDTQLGSRVMTVLIIFIIVYGTVTPMLGRLSLIDLSSAVRRDETLTGRTIVWQKLVPVAMNQPILGHGFGSFWSTEKRGVYDMTGAHNGYLDTILELGFVGLLLLSIFLISSLRKAQNMMLKDFDLGALLSCYMLMAVANNMAESYLNTFTFQTTAFILFLTVSFATTQLAQESRKDAIYP